MPASGASSGELPAASPPHVREDWRCSSKWWYRSGSGPPARSAGGDSLGNGIVWPLIVPSETGGESRTYCEIDTKHKNYAHYLSRSK